MIKRYTITKQHLDRMRIPKKYWSCKLADIPEVCVHKIFIHKYIEDLAVHVREGTGLLLHGDYGRGKTALGAIILKAGATFGHIGLFIRTDNLPTYVIEKTKFDETYTMMERIRDVPILVLDEVIIWGDKRDWYLESLIRDRVNEEKATILTSNLGPGQLRDKYPGLASVLKEAVLPVKIEGHDFREDIKNDISGDFGVTI